MYCFHSSRFFNPNLFTNRLASSNSKYSFLLLNLYHTQSYLSKKGFFPVYRQIKNVDVYDLILEHGYLGALEYSNLIDSKNTKLASEIDQIVYGFIKSAQAFAPIQQTPSYAPTPNIPQATPPSTPPSSPSVVPGPVPSDQTGTGVGAGSSIGLALASAGALYFRYKSLRYMMQQVLSAGDMSMFDNAMNTLKTSTAGSAEQMKATEIVSKIIAKTPTNVNNIYLLDDNGRRFLANHINLRQEFIDKIKLDPATALQDLRAEIAHKSAELLTKPRGVVEQKADAARRKLGLGGWESPAVSSFSGSNAFNVTPDELNALRANPENYSVILENNPSAEEKFAELFDSNGWNAAKALSEFEPLLNTALPPQLQKALAGKSIDEARKIIEQFDAKAGTPGKFAAQFEQHLLSDTALDASENALKTSATSETGTIAKLFQALASKLPAGAAESLSGILEMGSKFLGPIAIALEGKGVFDDYAKYGADGKTICDLVTTLIGLGTIFGGEVLGPIMPALWTLSTIGCAFVHHGEPANSNDKEVDKITAADINAREATVQLSDLSPNDKALATQIFNANQHNPENINSAFYSAMMAKKFEHPIDVMALAQKQINDGGVFGPKQPAPAPAYTEMNTLAPQAFNLSRYRLA